MDGLWASKSEGVWLIVRAISFQDKDLDFQLGGSIADIVRFTNLLTEHTECDAVITATRTAMTWAVYE